MTSPRLELRVDALTGLEVILAPDRKVLGGTRPPGPPAIAGRCPFCPGHEGDTEVTTDAIGDPWRARSVLNRFPLAHADARADAPAAAVVGHHEVLVETREHTLDLSEMDDAQVDDLADLWVRRARAVSQLEPVRTVALFRNRGRRAGSSQPHSHAQIVGLPWIPPTVRARMAGYATQALERELEAERSAGLRVIADRDGWITYCPFASPRAGWVRLAPTSGVLRFGDLETEHVRAFGRQLRRVARAALEVVGTSDYNILVIDPPRGVRGYVTIDIVPRTGGDAGFELGTGIDVCVAPPERTAERMRAALALDAGTSTVRGCERGSSPSS